MTWIFFVKKTHNGASNMFTHTAAILYSSRARWL